jgi:hypothetical protein
VTTQLQEVRAILVRLEKVEKENRMLKRFGLVVISLMSLVGATGQTRTSRTVEAERFVLKDDRGRERADLSVSSKGVALVFRDEAGRKQMTLNSLTSKAGLGHAWLALGEGAVDARYTLAGKARDEWATISEGGLFLAGQETARIVISASGTPGPSIEVVDSQGYAADLGVNRLEFPMVGKTRKASAASLVLLGKDRTVLWSAP